MTKAVVPHNKQVDPTPDEIKARAEKIRAGWSDTERRNREGRRQRDVTYVKIPISTFNINTLENSSGIGYNI